MMLRWFVLLMAIGWTACSGTPEPTDITAPSGSYVPARLTVVVRGASEVVDGAHVTPRFFAVNDLKPELGRFFIEADHRSPQPGVAVLSHRYWVDRFHADSAIIGSTIDVDGQRRLIIGVAPPIFQPNRAGSLWIPADN